MSMQLMVEALKAQVGHSGRKLVLIKLADNANDDGLCWPSYQTIADACEMGRSTVKEHIKALEKQGFITVRSRNDGKSSNHYLLHIRRGRSPAPTRSVSDPVKPQPCMDAQGIQPERPHTESKGQNPTGPDSNPVRNQPGQKTSDTRSEPDPHPVRFRPPPGQNLTPEPVIEPITEPVSEPVTKKHCPIAGAPVCDHRTMFGELWDSWPTGMGQKGSRKNAETAFLKLRPDQELFDQMRNALAAQAADKTRRSAEGQFIEQFQHVERWIRCERWLDEIDPFTIVPASCQPAKQAGRGLAQRTAGAVQHADASTLQRVTDRSWAEADPWPTV